MAPAWAQPGSVLARCCTRLAKTAAARTPLWGWRGWLARSLPLSLSLCLSLAHGGGSHHNWDAAQLGQTKIPTMEESSAKRPSQGGADVAVAAATITFGGANMCECGLTEQQQVEQEVLFREGRHGNGCP